MKKRASNIKGKHQDLQSHEVHVAALSQGMTTVFERFEAQQPQCGHCKKGLSCQLCSDGPCRISAKAPLGVCGASGDLIVARNLLQLAIIGTPNEVPDLVMAVRDPKISDMARYALEPMEDRGVDEVLIGTLPTVGPEIQVGIINTLAVRKSYGALDTLRALRNSPDPAVAAAASHAVGRIEGMIIP